MGKSAFVVSFGHSIAGFVFFIAHGKHLLSQKNPTSRSQPKNGSLCIGCGKKLLKLSGLSIKGQW